MAEPQTISSQSSPVQIVVPVGSVRAGGSGSLSRQLTACP